MNRIMVSMPKLISKISLIFMLLLMSMLCKAYPYIVSIKNCYQNISFYYASPPDNIQLLDFGVKPVISYSTNLDSDPYFAIRQYQTTSNSFEYVDFSTDHTAIPIGGGITVYENTTPTITLPSREPIILDLYHGGPSYPPRSMPIDFIGPDEAFRILPNNKSCFTYDNFQLKNDLTDLYGFCGVTGNYQLKLSPSTGSTMGLPANFSMNISMGQTATASTPVQVPINQSECTNPENSCAAYPPAPCRCMDFNFEFKLYPCTATQMPNCPTEITVSKPIKLCCNCGFQEPPISGTGRNTDNAELTQSGELSIFPNPNHNGKLQINTPNNPIRNIKIYAVDGRLVKELSVPELNQISVDISGLKPGLYQVKVIDNKDAISNQKLIVQ